ncbi:MAG: hypothetical protein DMD68_02315 [Gemmatimonadetes bacterium]|nr:MAG: hypothetical protein DMD68_02315 [Gemmatimonadota bacterium]
MRKLPVVLCGALLAGLAACKDPLSVENQNNADVNHALGTPTDLENFIGATYNTVHAGTLGGGNDALNPQMFTMSLENVSGLANFAMGPRGQIPRNPIDNTPNAQGDAGNLRDWTVEHRAARMATMGLAKLKVLTLGSPARDTRARLFAYFSLGAALGNLAMAYDSAAILTAADNFNAIIPMSAYPAVRDAALQNLDSAIALASAPAPPGLTSDWFPLPSTWINLPTGVALDTGLFLRFARSYKARILAGAARTPAERAAVVWDTVIAYANAGITADFNIAMLPSAGWSVAWPSQQFATGPANWHQLSQFILGMADTSGAYDAWLNTTRNNRVPFTVVTPDNRFPSGGAACPGATCRSAQSAVAVPGTFTSKPYVRNRPSGDQPGDAFGISQYDFYRSRAFVTASSIGPYPVMTAAEIRLLSAEGSLRKADFATAMTKINVTRTAAGLPALVGITDTFAVVPGGTGCVPRVPDIAKNFRGTKCGNIWDALKWEYRMETMYTGYGMWYFASRGWGDLPEGTAIQWPVPWEELLVRRDGIYGLGGVGQIGGAGKGNYGLFNGGVYGW